MCVLVKGMYGKIAAAMCPTDGFVPVSSAMVDGQQTSTAKVSNCFWRALQ
jgi:hypothetical protein